MDNEEMIQNFGDMVKAVEQLNEPWVKKSLHQTIALIVTNVLWAIIVFALIWFAYMTPTEVQQNQNLTEQTQTQSYNSGATNGG